MPISLTIPPSIRRGARAAYVAVGERTAGARVLPDFIVIGGQRCGTTSLFRALNQHPQMVRPTFNKGINYFDVHHDRGFDWYRGHFPTRLVASRRNSVADAEPIAYEASGYYMFHPAAMDRIADELPDVRLVVMLRDPVERAFSAWKHERARDFETENFIDALALEEERLDGEIERMLAEPGYQSYSHRHHAYRRRGEYGDLLADVVDRIGRSRLHVMFSESFFSEPEREFERLCEFLGATSPPANVSHERHNARPSDDMPDEARARLVAHFEPLDQRLEDVIGERPPWERTSS